MNKIEIEGIQNGFVVRANTVNAEGQVVPAAVYFQDRKQMLGFVIQLLSPPTNENGEENKTIILPSR